MNEKERKSGGISKTKKAKCRTFKRCYKEEWKGSVYLIRNHGNEPTLPIEVLLLGHGLRECVVCWCLNGAQRFRTKCPAQKRARLPNPERTLVRKPKYVIAEPNSKTRTVFRKFEISSWIRVLFRIPLVCRFSAFSLFPSSTSQPCLFHISFMQPT